MKEFLTKLKENKIDLEILSDVEGYQKIVYKKGTKNGNFVPLYDLVMMKSSKTV